MTYFAKFACSLILILCSLARANADNYQSSPLNVVTSFSILADLAKELGGDNVKITNLVGANSDGHLYQPRPSDVVAVSAADLLIFNGLNFEGWMSRLIQSSGFDGAAIEASAGVRKMYHGDEVDPHAWQSLQNIKIYAKNINKALIEALPNRKADLNYRYQAFTEQVDALIAHSQRSFADIPIQNRIVITNHDAFGYLGRDLKVAFIAPVGISTDEEPSAADLAALIQQIKSKNVKALFLENISNKRLLQQISAEAGVSVGGILYSDALSEREGPASTYLKMMNYNLRTLSGALK
ncbi:metal ABC transporter solute-binding protein, Zn/Mn family [Teredinibacter turnerae]|uniref:metal ABC transporter solute-binding protein, Zn/Mn family n=1 Tax=Teredinibacter turnerae TaxID=2426 RepID=UPI0004235C4E|nr:zinc ABC transporter substrate-binding protein [Teredinibacter turnerae]